MLFQGGLLIFCVLANVHLSKRPPDVVLVDGSGGAEYVPRKLVGLDVLMAIQRAKGQPTDAEVGHVTREFLTHFAGVNSTSVETSWAAALSMMDPALASKLSREYSERKVLAALKASNSKTDLVFEDVKLIERTDTLLHVRARIRRTHSSLLTGGNPVEDVVGATVFLAVEGRNMQFPSGLRVRDISVAPYKEPPGAAPPGSGVAEINP
ncbi:hypothetical protein D7V88_40620 [Corallococcus terminator]|uniref:Uncharacterized protein n=2 Tax=Corallococcus terminator TaxID=2316733 RepID=A0A3A8HMC4_9BACT|nr:hypothetical protein D7V88_40620 [Corallococcus terminator]